MTTFLAKLFSVSNSMYIQDCRKILYYACMSNNLLFLLRERMRGRKGRDLHLHRSAPALTVYQDKDLCLMKRFTLFLACDTCQSLLTNKCTNLPSTNIVTDDAKRGSLSWLISREGDYGIGVYGLFVGIVFWGVTTWSSKIDWKEKQTLFFKNPCIVSKYVASRVSISNRR